MRALTAELRHIELIVQERIAVEGIEQAEKDTLAQIQEHLYSTADGFEVGRAIAS